MLARPMQVEVMDEPERVPSNFVHGYTASAALLSDAE